MDAERLNEIRQAADDAVADNTLICDGFEVHLAPRDRAFVRELLEHSDELQATVTHYQTQSAAGGYQPTDPGGPIGTPPTTADMLDQGDGDVCPDCGGSGVGPCGCGVPNCTVHKYPPLRCETCAGTGRVPTVNRAEVEAAAHSTGSPRQGSGQAGQAEPEMPADGGLVWEEDNHSMWFAPSAYHDDGDHFMYRIRLMLVEGEARYDLLNSTSELGVDNLPLFTSLDAAKEHCQANERQILADDRTPGDMDVRVTEPERLQHSLAEWACPACGAVAMPGMTCEGLEKLRATHAPDCTYAMTVLDDELHAAHAAAEADGLDAARAEHAAAQADVAVAKAASRLPAGRQVAVPEA